MFCRTSSGEREHLAARAVESTRPDPTKNGAVDGRMLAAVSTPLAAKRAFPFPDSVFDHDVPSRVCRGHSASQLFPTRVLKHDVF